MHTTLWKQTLTNVITSVHGLPSMVDVLPFLVVEVATCSDKMDVLPSLVEEVGTCSSMVEGDFFHGVDDL